MTKNLTKIDPSDIIAGISELGYTNVIYDKTEDFHMFTGDLHGKTWIADVGIKHCTSDYEYLKESLLLAFKRRANSIGDIPKDILNE